MKMRLFIAAFALAGLLGSGQSLAQNAYITNSLSNNVSVIDTVTNKIIATIPVGDGPIGVAVTPDGSKVYITNVSDSTVSVINTATNKVIATIPVGDGPIGVAVTPNGTKVYITNRSSTVSVIDTATNTVIAIIPVGLSPFGVAVTPDGSKVYVANANSFSVSVIDAATNKVIATIPFGLDNHPFGVTVTPDGSKVYVTNNNFLPVVNHGISAGSVSVIDTATNTVVATIPTVPEGSVKESGGVAVTPDGSTVYVTNVLGLPGVDGSVSVIDTATNTVIATIPVGSLPSYGVAVTPDGSKVYVANDASNTVSVIDTKTNTVIATVPVGVQPFAFGIFIQPAKSAPKFAGIPGHHNCYGVSVAALVRHYHGLNAAAAALGYPSVKALQAAIMEFCEG